MHKTALQRKELRPEKGTSVACVRLRFTEDLPTAWLEIVDFDENSKDRKYWQRKANCLLFCIECNEAWTKGRPFVVRIGTCESLQRAEHPWIKYSQLVFWLDEILDELLPNFKNSRRVQTDSFDYSFLSSRSHLK